jgi:hypothetical protein
VTSAVLARAEATSSSRRNARSVSPLLAVCMLRRWVQGSASGRKCGCRSMVTVGAAVGVPVGRETTGKGHGSGGAGGRCESLNESGPE